ncbi:MAG: hypothetical protein FWC16_13025 [Defluviitaleaceae bacterium]|nr:hypothetical protein [Defluviitaleaceae bacterium]MCL2275843.1 hypothetical protein [Defluviitaleaceae bacterium]
MAVRPIDVSLNIQHASDMARLGASDAQGRPEVAAQQFADRMEKQAKQQQEQVNKTAESEKGDVNPDRQGHGGGYHANRKNAKKKPAVATAKKPTARGGDGESMYNILI